jgi:hypothetical protein
MSILEGVVDVAAGGQHGMAIMEEGSCPGDGISLDKSEIITIKTKKFRSAYTKPVARRTPREPKKK